MGVIADGNAEFPAGYGPQPSPTTPISGQTSLRIAKNSYPCSVGYWTPYPAAASAPPPGGPYNDTNASAEIGQAHGVFQFQNAVSINGITDGTSNTMAIGEHAFALLTAGDDKVQWYWWHSGSYGDSAFSTIVPPNYLKKNATNYQNQPGGGSRALGGASSLHPGGMNICFADGSVKFIKETIGTWQVVAGNNGCGGGADTLPVGYTPSCGGSPGTVGSLVGTPPGVWQALGSRNGGEVISADQY